MYKRWLLALLVGCPLLFAPLAADATVSTSPRSQKPEVTSNYVRAKHYYRKAEKENTEYTTSVTYIFDDKRVRRIDIAIQLLVPEQSVWRGTFYYDEQRRMTWAEISYIDDVHNPQPCGADWAASQVFGQSVPTRYTSMLCPSYMPITLPKLTDEVKFLKMEMDLATQEDNTDGQYLVPRSMIEPPPLPERLN
ncbi:MAG: hypothetical protein AAB883_01985 [Patescibacteria group bacterium]